MRLTEEQKTEVIDALSDRVGNFDCPICHKTSFTIIDGYVLNQIHSKVENSSYGGPSLPTIALVCNNCGFVSQHALGALGLLPKKNVEDNIPQTEQEVHDKK